MDALLTTFIAAALAESGDKTQWLVAALAARYGRAGPILVGVAVAAFATSLIAAAGGVFLHGLITARATSLLVAVALVYAGIAGLIGARRPDIGADWRTGAFLTTAGAFFLLEFGDKSQFLTGALAARFDALVFTVAGATAGIVAANAPAVLLRDRLAILLPLPRIRIGAAVLFLLAGFAVAVNALKLI